MQLTEKEKLTLYKYEKFLYESNVSEAYLVEFIKLTLEYCNVGSQKYLSELHNVSIQYISKKCSKHEVNGVKFYKMNK